jgi:hypothetical protein
VKTNFLLLTFVAASAVCDLTTHAVRAQDIDNFAPVVVKTVPEAGSKDLPPGKYEVKVTFSKEMADQSWSWSTAWQNSDPPSLGKPHYLADHKTCVMKVKLEPGKDYGWWLNSEKFKNFRDRAGQSAVPYLLTFSTKGARSQIHSQIATQSDRVIATNSIELELDRALSQARPGKREAEINRIQRTIASDDVPAALAFLVKSGQTGMHSLFGNLASKWASEEAGAAVAWATNLPAAGPQKSTLVNIMKGWTHTAPEAAAAFAAALPAGELHDDAVLMVANEWSFADPGAAASWVSQLPPGQLRDKAAGPVIFWGQGQAPAAVAEMLDGFGEPELIQKNGETLASIWLTRDDVAARSWIEKSSLSEEVKQRLLKPN